MKARIPVFQADGALENGVALASPPGEQSDS